MAEITPGMPNVNRRPCCVLSHRFRATIYSYCVKEVWRKTAVAACHLFLEKKNGVIVIIWKPPLMAIGFLFIGVTRWVKALRSFFISRYESIQPHADKTVCNIFRISLVVCKYLMRLLNNETEKSRMQGAHQTYFSDISFILIRFGGEKNAVCGSHKIYTPAENKSNGLGGALCVWALYGWERRLNE